MKRAATGITLLFLFLSFQLIATASSITISQNQQSDSPMYDVNDAYLGNLEQTITIRNPTNQSIPDLELIVPLIRNETARHYILSTNISSSAGNPTVRTDAVGNGYAQWTGLQIASGTSLTFEIDYLELSFSTEYQINKSNTTAYDSSSEIHAKFTKPEPLIESNNPEISNKAGNLTVGASNPAEMVSDIYNYVIKHLHYVEQKEEKGALWALNSSIGDCSEYSYLFVALCRAAGVPARINAGFAFYPDASVVHSGHMWAEYYLEGYSWIPVDATWQILNSIDYRHFDQVDETSVDVPYANYMYSSIDENKLEDQQTVTLRAAQVESAPIARNVFDSIFQVRKSHLAVSIINPIGSWLFPQEIAQASALLTGSKVSLQHGIETLDAASLKDSFDAAAKASQVAWVVLTRIIAIVLTAIILSLSAILMLQERRLKKQNSWVI